MKKAMGSDTCGSSRAMVVVHPVGLLGRSANLLVHRPERLLQEYKRFSPMYIDICWLTDTLLFILCIPCDSAGVVALAVFFFCSQRQSV